jgi:hypothetical protein
MNFATALRIRPGYLAKLDGTPLAQCWCCDRLTRRAVERGDEDGEPFGLCSPACEARFYAEAREFEQELAEDAILEQQEYEAIDGGDWAEAYELGGDDW